MQIIRMLKRNLKNLFNKKLGAYQSDAASNSTFQFLGNGGAANTFVINYAGSFSYTLTSSHYFLIPKGATRIAGWKIGLSADAGADFQMGFYTAEDLWGTQTAITGSLITISNGTRYQESSVGYDVSSHKYVCPYFYVPSGVVYGPFQVAIFFS